MKGYAASLSPTCRLMPSRDALGQPIPVFSVWRETDAAESADAVQASIHPDVARIVALSRVCAPRTAMPPCTAWDVVIPDDAHAHMSLAVMRAFYEAGYTLSMPCGYSLWRDMRGPTVAFESGDADGVWTEETLEQIVAVWCARKFDGTPPKMIDVIKRYPWRTPVMRGIAAFAAGTSEHDPPFSPWKRRFQKDEYNNSDDDSDDESGDDDADDESGDDDNV